MNSLLSVIIATLSVSLISFVGILSFTLKEELLQKIILFLVSLSAGTLIGGAFFHLLPEALEINSKLTMVFVVLGFVLFFLIEKVLHWQHCHKLHCEVHTFAYMNLIGDAVHNMIDGLIIAASFSINASLGWITTLTIAAHELPQEMGDFGVLLYGGFKKSKALLFNFLVALTSIGGGILGYFLFSNIKAIQFMLLAIASGGFIYIAACDLIPEIQKEKNFKNMIINFLIFAFSIIMMYYFSFLE